MQPVRRVRPASALVRRPGPPMRTKASTRRRNNEKAMSSTAPQPQPLLISGVAPTELGDRAGEPVPFRSPATTVIQFGTAVQASADARLRGGAAVHRSPVVAARELPRRQQQPARASGLMLEESPAAFRAGKWRDTSSLRIDTRRR